LSFAKSAIYFAIRSIIFEDVPNNAGFFRPIKVVAEPGSLVNPLPPGACAARGVTGFRVIDALTGALAQAVPERVRAPGEGGTTSYSIAGYDRNGTYFQFREAIMGCWGAGANREGIDGVANPAANISNAPIEAVENTAPIRVERYELVTDSGGPGQWRGGMAVLRELRYLGDNARLQLRSDRRHHPPFGLNGGQAGTPSRNLFDNAPDGPPGAGQGVDWEDLPTKFVHPIRTGQAIRHTTAGGGGYGDPFQRLPERVLDDVYNGKVSPAAAARDYGVAVIDQPWRIDAAKTEALRQARVATAGQEAEAAGE
jgi:N-methylhydantoinase B